MNTLKGKKVLMFQQRGWSKRIGHPLAKMLQQEGCSLAALTFKAGIHKFTLNQDEVTYASIVSNDDIVRDPKKYLAGDDYDLSEICNALGVDSIWPIAASLRNHVKSYGKKYYYSFQQNVSDKEIVDYIKAVYKYALTIFDTFSPDVIIMPNFTEPPHSMLSIYAEKRGVKTVVLTDSKIIDVSIATYDYLDQTGPFFDRVDILNKGEAVSKNSNRAKEYIAEFRKKIKQPDYIHWKPESAQLMKKIRFELSPYRKIYKWYTQEQTTHIPNLGVMKDYRPPRIILRDHFGYKRYRKFMNSYNYYPFDKLGKYVYFPLQYQPEESIDVKGTFFSNQIETARLTAMSLPDDYTLVVKEHPIMLGLRSPSYMEKIAKTPNVKLIDYRIPSERVIKNADLMVSASGTVISEAAFYNKPVIQLGDLGTTLKLPNVFQHKNMSTLSKRIKELLTSNLTDARYEKKLENYVAAAYDEGLEINYVELWVKADVADMDKLLAYFKKEIERAL